MRPQSTLSQDDPVEPDASEEAEHLRRRLELLEGRYASLRLLVDNLRRRRLDRARFDGAIEELSERKRAERSFMASEERFRIVFETAEIGIALTDMQTRITRANPALCRFLQRTEADLVGRCFDDLLVDTDRAGPLVAQPGEAGEPPKRTAERGFATARGDTVVGYTSVTWLSDGQGRPFQAAVVVQDVTLRRKLEDDLVRVQKLESLALLAGGIAHDFNNFLSAILGNLSLALQSRGDMAECLAAAQDAAMRARDVTRQLLTFANGGAPVNEVYLADVLIRLQDHPVGRVAELLPHRWKETFGSGFTVERVVTPPG